MPGPSARVVRDLSSQVGFLRRHPGYGPGRSEARLVAWRLLSLRRRPIQVNFHELGFRLEIPAEWRGMSKLAYVFREDAEPELRRLHLLVPTGGTAIDVGAHYGDYTLALSTLVGSEGRVVAIEPMRHAVDVLRRNLLLNRATNVEVEPNGIGREPARAMLHLHADPSRASLGKLERENGSEVIEITTLDEIVHRLGLRRVDFVKLDIEGGEYDALEGGRSVIERYQPVIQFEHQPGAAERLGHSGMVVWELLTALGFSFAALNDSGRLCRVDGPDRWGPNYFAIPDRRSTLITDPD